MYFLELSYFHTHVQFLVIYFLHFIQHSRKISSKMISKCRKLVGKIGRCWLVYIAFNFPSDTTDIFITPSECDLLIL